MGACRKVESKVRLNPSAEEKSAYILPRSGRGHFTERRLLSAFDALDPSLNADPLDNDQHGKLIYLAGFTTSLVAPVKV